jgi:hypothetical protein
MKVKAPFGFVTACHPGDKHMVGATLASMKFYCPDMPICLIADGDVDVSDLESEYDLIVLRIDELPSREMSQMITGSYLAKLAAMWEGPFEFYIWVDSDAIIWGNIINQVRTDLDFQIFWPEVSIPVDADEVPPWLAHYYFNLEQLHDFDPDFEWRGYPYFSAGVYACRRNVISFEQWKDVGQWEERVPGLFKFGDQGILNYMVLAKSQRNEIKMTWSDLQWVRSCDHEGLISDSGGAGWNLPKKVGKPMVLHFCGRKPYTFARNCYTRPFTVARLEHHRRKHSNWRAWLVIIIEDGKTLWIKVISKIKRLLIRR